MLHQIKKPILKNAEYKVFANFQIRLFFSDFLAFVQLVLPWKL